MKAITLYQPWAGLVAIGVKRIETRSWGTFYRGTLAIHSSKNLKFYDLMKEEPYHRFVHRKEFFQFGMIIAKCQLVGMERIYKSLVDKLKKEQPLEFYFGDYSLGRWAWILENIELIDPSIPVKGTMGLWEWKEIE